MLLFTCILRRLGRARCLAVLSVLLTGSSAGAEPATEHWAFQPVVRPPLPAARDASRVRNEVDLFIQARLDRMGLAPSPEADRHTLIRRLSLDLTGLLPTPEQVNDFIEDESPAAYQALVDRLLESPHFGEKWARHWLDLARYADSDGYEKDSVRPFAYLYRDWVIKAINRDLPYDEFSIQQLAGDLLPAAGDEERIATGFHRNTLTNKEGGVDQEEYRCKATVDRVNTTGTVWMGLTIGCAECHTHKYDPISHQEYYQFYAFFNNASEREFALGDKVKAAVLAEEPGGRKTHIHLRGDFLRRGEEVTPGVPAMLPPLQARLDRGDRPDRLDLARWLFDARHPLTARVAVNRIWGHLFGRGLVTTPADFGTRGDPPSHPELLDWLASEFPRLNWSRKQLVRLLVTSATYRQSSVFRPELLEQDPENRWLARQNRLRLPAETIRDVFLSASGLLERALGGPSIRPPMPADIAAVAYANSVKWPESPGADKYRRGLYVFWQRTVPYPMLTVFDAPDGNVTCSRREISNTPLQALTLLNDPVFTECAQHLARQIGSAGEEPRPRIAAAFERCVGRPASGSELERLLLLFEGHCKLAEVPTAAFEATPAQHALAAVCRIIMNTDEFITRE